MPQRSELSNLVQSAFKLTRDNSNVVLLIDARKIPGTGCVFTIDHCPGGMNAAHALLKHSLPPGRRAPT